MTLFKKKKSKVKEDEGWTEFLPYDSYENQEEFDKDFCHFGKVRVNSEMLFNEMMVMRDIMKDIFVVKTDHDALSGTITFLGISKHFEPTPARLMENAPEYILTINTKIEDEEKYYKYKFEKAFDNTSSNSVH